VAALVGAGPVVAYDSASRSASLCASSCHDEPVRARACLFLLAWTLPATLSAADEASACDPAEAIAAPLHLEPGVRDPVWAVLLGLFSDDRFGCVSGVVLEEEVKRLGNASRLPFRRLRRIVRRRDQASGVARTTIELNEGRLKVPIPYQILWIYRPGDIWVDSTIELTERRLGPLTVKPPQGEDIELKGTGVFRLSRGTAGADIDALIDRLFGKRLDDMTVHGLATFVTDDRWWGLAIGANRKGASRMGLFDFSADAIVFPTPKRLWPVARRMRSALAEMSEESGREPDAPTR